MFELETPRLRLIPLHYDELKLTLDNRHLLEERLGLELTDVELDEHFRDVLQNIILPKLLHDPANYLWLTEWQIVLKAENRIIGGFCFKHVPSESDQIEIGYGTQGAYQNQGYTTEAIKAAVDWALDQPGVVAVTAETEKDNVPSMRVLDKVGMQRTHETEEFYYWIVRKQ